MKRFIIAMILGTVLFSVAGCFVVVREDGGEDHGGHEKHEDRHEEGSH